MPKFDLTGEPRPETGSRPLAGLPRTLWAYAASEFLFCFAVAFLFFFAIFFVNQLLLMAEDILAKKAPPGQVFLLLLYATPSIFAISFPFASLVGALMATGRFSSDGEILACMAAGIRVRTVFTPFLVLALAISASSFVMNDFFLPLGTLEFGKLYRQVIASTPAVELGPYSVKRFGEAVVVTGAARKGDIGDILVFDSPRNGERRIIGASRARLDMGIGAFEATLTLDDVWLQTLKREKKDSFEWSEAASLTYRVKLRERGDALVQIGPREMASRDLAKAIREKRKNADERLHARRLEMLASRERLDEIYESGIESGSTWKMVLGRASQNMSAVKSLSEPVIPDRNLQIYRLEYAKKFSIPAGALFFVFLAFPLGLGTKRAGRSVGFGLGILVSVFYWALLLAGQTLGTRFNIAPTLAMWAPNAVAIVAGSLFWARRTGGGM
jgi:lipopolysaccharide export system permease protein